MSDTPKTEAAAHHWMSWQFSETIEFARNLERDAARWKSLCDQLWKAKGRYNTQLAFCKIGEALGHQVQWPNAEGEAQPPAKNL